MTKRWAIIAAALALLIVALVFWQTGRARAGAPPASAPPPTASSPQGDVRPAATVAAAPAESRSTLADALNSPTGDIRADLRIVSEVVDAFRTNFPRNGNPVGSNEEITAALSGKNQLRLALIPADHPAINKAGELCDRWGTPFFFHSESATRMEIRSAGPDQKMWNEDDVVFTP